ncbi:MAG: hypothetical protein ACR2JB_22215 [Bryobacteraceae bacterium]
MPTRREFLLSILSTPLAAAFVQHPLEPPGAELEIIPEPHCLSEESANGFRLLLNRNKLPSRPLSKVVIIPGARQLSCETAFALRRQVSAGAWLILESGLAFMPRHEATGQIRVLRDVFGLEVQAPLANRGAYIEYTWPLRRLVRDFSMVTPLKCSRAETIAEIQGVAVCAKRPVGKGSGIIFLGSMLGPGLLAEEREAHEIGSAMLREIVNGGL